MNRIWAVPVRSRVDLYNAPVAGVHATYSSSGHCFDKHWHDAYGFGLLDDGAQAWSSGRGLVRAYPGNVIGTNPGEVHDGRPIGAETRAWRIVSIVPSAMADIAGVSGESFEIAQPVIDDPDLAAALARLFRAFERGDAAAHRLSFEENLTRACGYLVARHGNGTRVARPVAASIASARDRLADDPGNTPSLTELAAASGLSKFQFLRRFENAYGLTPFAWLTRARAERARELIREGKTLAQAASRVGFADQSHMNRVFVRQYGFTPGTWQRAIASKT